MTYIGALLEIVILKVAEEDTFITSLAVHSDKKGEIGSQIQQDQGLAVENFLSRPEFFISIGVGSMILVLIGIIVVRKKNRSRNNHFIMLPSKIADLHNHFETESIDVCYETQKHIHPPSEFNVDQNENGFGNKPMFKQQSFDVWKESQKQHQEGFERVFFSKVSTGNSDSASDFATMKEEDWLESQKQVQDYYNMRRMQLSSLMANSLVDIDSDSCKSDVFDNIDW